MTRPRQWAKTLLAGAGLAAVAALAAVGTTIVIELARGDDTPNASTPTPTTAATAAAELRVAALMADMTCQGKVIETQLHSKETGRCKLDGVTVTVAVFADDQLRDRWASFAAEFGGNLVVGARWAAMADTPDAAEKVANLLDGQRV